ncbi:MAG: DUF192 domain-containing protein [Alphaproteobacteria bacterium]|nr:DUF192 domain-containing protein [Alphaproteobacteria bacterium]
MRDAFILTARRVFAALLCALALSATAACSDESRLTVHTDTGDFAFSVELADTPAEQAKGLMFREALAEDAGMLFDFHEERQASFWMQNTLVPLDMLFIAADGTIRNIHLNARPLDPTSIPSEGPVRFVLEISGGRSKEIGARAGDRVSHPRIAGD